MDNSAFVNVFPIGNSVAMLDYRSGTTLDPEGTFR